MVVIYQHMLVHQMFLLERDWSYLVTLLNMLQLKLGNTQYYYIFNFEYCISIVPIGSLNFGY